VSMTAIWFKKRRWREGGNDKEGMVDERIGEEERRRAEEKRIGIYIISSALGSLVDKSNFC
jgi:hypothetical protein